jgi:integrase
VKGHIRERSPGRWAIILDVRDPQTGERKRKWHSFSGTKRAAQTECARLIAAMAGGAYLEPSKMTVAQFLEQWLAHMKSQVSPKTHERYGDIARKNLVPLLGAAPLQRLRPEQISSAYAEALASGHRQRPGGLSPRTVHHMHRVLLQSLGQAVVWGAIAKNPAAVVRPPKVERTPMRALDTAETALLLDHLRPTRMFVPVLLGVLCGLRRGEIAALRWGRVDLDAGQMAVAESTEQTRAGLRHKETKNGKVRTVALPAYVVEELRRHRVRQAEELFKFGVRASDATFVVAKADGAPIRPNTLTEQFRRRLLTAPALPPIRFHDLRHSHATQMLVSGVHPKVAQERLGHATIAITLDLYSHIIAGPAGGCGGES